VHRDAQVRTDAERHRDQQHGSEATDCDAQADPLRDGVTRYAAHVPAERLDELFGVHRDEP
jgi:hypothetical protein